MVSQSSKEEGFVDYIAFSDAVEEAFTTKNLETSPEKIPVPVCGHILNHVNFLSRLLRSTCH